MRTKALIIPYRKSGNITIVGSYRDNNSDKEIFLLASGKKVVTSLSESDRVFQHTFEDAQSYEFTFSADDFADLAVLDFWKNHPLVKTDGYSNGNLISEQFELVVKQEKVKVDYEELMKKLSVVADISKMEYSEQYNLMFAIGGDPREMTPTELYLSLIGLTLNGLAIAKKDVVKQFLSVRAAEKIATVYANKAIKYGIVTKEQSVYKIGGRNAGTSIDSVIALINSDIDMFENYIKPEVDKYDNQELLKFETFDPLNLPDEIKDLLPVNTATEKKRVRRGPTE
jgi:hypothetical protein